MLRHLSLLLVAVVTVNAVGLIHSPPRITKQPPTDEILFQVAQTGENDKPFVIECEAEGEPAPKYTWIKNGKKFEWQTYDDRMSQQPGRGTLVITAPRDEDLGQYQCFAKNEHGTATSNSVFVRKAELNSFKDDMPKPVEAEEGKPFQLQCQPPDGWPKPQVHWLIQTVDGNIKSINNSRMTLDPEGNLWFSNVTRQDASDDFYYACSANSIFRNEYKLGNRVVLEVKQSGIAATQNKYQPTRQYVSRKNEIALRGKKIELFCIYGGTPLPQTLWMKNGRPIPWSERIQQGNYGKSIVIKHMQLDDAGSYTCEVSNGVGQADSYSINLEVKAIPYFTIEPEIQNAAEGETVEFQCEAKGIPPPEIKWIHNGVDIGKAPPNSRRRVYQNRIIIDNLAKSDTGNYGCNATNALGYVYKDVYLNVLALPPEIVEPPHNEATVDKRTVIMKCRVFGAPKPTVKWIKDGKPMSGGRYSVQPNGDLEIRDVQASDAGELTCYAENKLGSKEASGTLTVMEHTKITDPPKDYEVKAGDSATFRCNAVADSKLDLDIKWLNNNEEIDFDEQPRFFKANDYSLTISKATELDSGNYTCVAVTDLDEARASATLIVQDVPNPPNLKDIQCNAHDATIDWESQGDNRSPILYFTIQYNTSFTPDTWEVAFDKVPSTDFSYTISMSPWANYTFRVLAWNKVGPSKPSAHSGFCTTQPDVPYKNPDNVEGKGTQPNNLVIKWSPMPEIEHNAEGFQYRVYWRRDLAGEWNQEDIYDWQRNELVIDNQQTFQKYRIKVVAINKMGEANVAAKEVIGYSGEDKPLEAPKDFKVLNVVDAKQALLSWVPVSEESVRGHFKGYKIQTWTEGEGQDNYREIIIKNDADKALVTKFTPDAVNFARILAFNERYNGPFSNEVQFKTPEGVPSSIQSLEVFPLGSSAFHLKWKKPLQPNGKLTGYRIYYQEVDGTQLQEKKERKPAIDDPKVLSTKLAGLKENTKYRVHVVATTQAGEGEDYFVEQNTNAGGALKPEKPYFSWDHVLNEDGTAKVKVKWLPTNVGNAGSHFYVKYRKQGESTWIDTNPEIQEDFQEIAGLEPDTSYEMRLVAVDGDMEEASESQIVDTSDVGVRPVPTDTLLAGWLIGMLLAIAFLLLLLIIVCIIKRNRGGKYDVHDREMANGRQDYPEDGGFHEYSQPLDNKSAGRQSLNSQKGAAGVESDTDSMAEYGEGDTEGMNEDGSFIGQYGRRGRQQDSQAFATLV
ncbi:neuroglian isoform X2 [Culicoides brevitarsis]|uniref:neuroglian isoform X2 n=1 Tax=Culicoides brevitarsis TaxID=469753 RepID=UPI00307BB4E4